MSSERMKRSRIHIMERFILSEDTMKGKPFIIVVVVAVTATLAAIVAIAMAVWIWW